MTLVRYAVLALPAGVLIVAWLGTGRAAVQRGHTDRRREAGALLLAYCAAFVGLAGLHWFAQRLGWWSYAPLGGAYAGLPVDLWIGWAVLWGPVPVLLRRWLRPAVAVLVAGWIDVLAMPRLAPLVRLGDGWLLGEAAGLLLVALPAILLGVWTAERRRLPARATLQVALFAGLLLWLVPDVAAATGHAHWPTWTPFTGGLAAQAAAVVAAPAILAVREFVTRGGGTPFPWDPPVRLVTTGPYAYVANPMQLSAIGLLLLEAAVLRSWVLAGAAGSGALFSIALAGFHEHADLAERLGAPWYAYRKEVRDWRPRRVPYRTARATIYFAEGCGPCERTRQLVARTRPVGLEFRAAQQYDGGLWRVRYEDADGYRADGVAAVARALEHAPLGWALIGGALRLPILDRFIQLVLDALGLGPRYAGPETEAACPASPTRRSA
ncbi:methyltransferase family protein [Hamadaea tsunoensis]|uniref:methyltransferase family protein n=1 Tax=Hamadaea tsunoensis TaxID=53368 RepID=UPI000407BDFB|nr:isoprenylcysteine carboxylmethyltransferase family protein [Hamadaea tsunoensis]